MPFVLVLLPPVLCRMVNRWVAVGWGWLCGLEMWQIFLLRLYNLFLLYLF